MPQKLSRDPNVNWRDNSIQFPRLIAELEAAGGFSEEIMSLLAESMDLPQSAVVELIDRAQREWDELKRS